MEAPAFYDLILDCQAFLFASSYFFLVNNVIIILEEKSLFILLTFLGI